MLNLKFIFFTEFTEATNEYRSRHMLSPYTAYYH